MKKIKQLQALLKEKNIKAYIIPTSDYHNSEYVSDYFKGRTYLSGFTGSAGTLLVTQDKAFLWTDGRYHIQAAKQIEGKQITLMKQGLDGVPTIEKFLSNFLKENETLAFDGKVISTNLANKIIQIIPNINIKYDEDLLDELWNERPELPFSMLYNLDEYFSGESFNSKRAKIRNKMKELDATSHIIVSLEDQAWLYNLRANDVVHTPVFLAYTIITNNECHLFINEKKIDKTIEIYLKENNVTTHDYFEFYNFIKSIENQNILIDLNTANFTIFSSIKDKNTIINQQNPSLIYKSIKNQQEIKNIKNAHIKDGVAFTHFMYYVKNNVSKLPLSEISVSEYLQEQRSIQDGFIDISFNTICAYKEHAAMMHYSATVESNYSLEPNDLLLIDSGGHYLDGSTDITRTLALGPLNTNQKLHFTTVLKSMIALSQAVFLKGIKGTNLDILARGPIWKLLLDYKCGTGHGIGFLLSVHEAPNGFRWQIVPERNDSAVLQPGMITTNEPGIYLENKYGIRIENELLCVEKAKNEFGDFLEFETITYAPIDLDAIDVTLLNEEERKWLNDYHQLVYDKLSSYIDDEDELSWFKHITRKI